MKLKGESLGMGALMWACLTIASRLCMILQVSHFTAPDGGVERVNLEMPF